MKEHKIIIALLTVILFTGNLVAQSIVVNGLDNKSNFNSFNLHLAATKLCRDFYANKDLNKERMNKSGYKIEFERYSRYGCHVCVESIRSPYMSPLENFADRFLNDKRIFRNKSNVFTVKAVRKELNDKYLDAYNALIDSVDTENMVYYQYDLVQGYSFETNEMFISLWNPYLKGMLPNATTQNLIFHPLLMEHGLTKEGGYIHKSTNNLGYFRVPMTSEQAEQIYSNYASYHRPNPPFAVATKLHFAIRLSKALGGQPRYYQIILKKAEFFLPNMDDLKRIQSKLLWNTYRKENKIAEVIFEAKVHHTQDGLAYQNVLSIK